MKGQKNRAGSQVPGVRGFARLRKGYAKVRKVARCPHGLKPIVQNRFLKRILETCRARLLQHRALERERSPNIGTK
jgi:hypothetical protein